MYHYNDTEKAAIDIAHIMRANGTIDREDYKKILEEYDLTDELKLLANGKINKYLLKNITTAGQLADALSKLEPDTPLSLLNESDFALVYNENKDKAMLDYSRFYDKTTDEGNLFDEADYNDFEDL